MTTDLFFEQFDRLAEAPNGVAKLRELILQMAVRGRLVPQDCSEVPASQLLAIIESKRNGRLKSRELPFSILDQTAEDEPQIPPGWAPIRLGIVIELTSGQHLKPTEYNQVREGYPYLTGPADFGEKHPTASRWTLADRALALPEDILITVKGAGIGKTNIVAEETVFISRQLMAVRPIAVDRDFIHYVLRSSYDQFQRQGVGIAIPGIGREDILNLSVLLPPLDEQLRIVAKVDHLMALCDELEARQQAKRETRERLVASALDTLTSARDASEFDTHWHRLRDHFDLLFDHPSTSPPLRKSILTLAVQGKLVPQDPHDEPAEVLLKDIEVERRRFSQTNKFRLAPTKSANIDPSPYNLPANWIWCRLSSLFNCVTDGDHLPPPKSDDGVAFLTIGNITTGRLNFEGSRFVPDSYYQALADIRRPTRGDILYTVVGATYGRAALVETDRPFCVQRHIAILKPPHCLDVGFLKALLESPLVYEQATASTTGTAQPTIPLGALRNFIVPLPPLFEQRRIVAKVNELMLLTADLESKLHRAETASESLLTSTVSHLLNGSVTFDA